MELYLCLLWGEQRTPGIGPCGAALLWRLRPREQSGACLPQVQPAERQPVPRGILARQTGGPPAAARPAEKPGFPWGWLKQLSGGPLRKYTRGGFAGGGIQGGENQTWSHEPGAA